MARKQVSRKRSEKRILKRCAAHIRSTFNNTIVTITDEFGNALSWSSAGALVQRIKINTIRSKWLQKQL